MRKFGIVEKTFFVCAGASIEGLSQCPESEHRKYGFIGSIIVLTSLFAMLSGGYAFYFIFNSELHAALFAMLWGLFILNIDRLIVSSMRKSDSAWKEFRQALPRFVLALIIAFAIARPLEMGIFSDAIGAYLVEQRGANKVEVMKEFNSYIGKIKEGFNARIADDTALLQKYLTDRESTCAARDDAHKQYLCEQDGTCGTSEKGYGPVAAAKRTRYSQLGRDCAELSARATEIQARISKLQNAFDRGLSGSIDETLGDDEVLALEETSEINRLKEERDKRLREVEQNFSTSFASRNSALWGLQRSDYSVMATSFIISLLFIVVEAAPITVKLLAQKGPYDYYLDFERDSAEANYLRGRDKLYEEKGTEFKREMEFLERQKHVETFKAFQAAKAPMEKELLNKMLEEWRQKTELSGGQIESIDSGLKRMFEDYASINASRTEKGLDPLPAFRYPGAEDAESRQQSLTSGVQSVVNRFLIVPMTFIVTVISFMIALKIHSPISPYLVAFLSGIIYITLSIVYFSIKGKSSGKEDEK